VSEPVAPDLGWHVLSGEHLLDLLRRAHAGENPDLLMVELWANAEREKP
jgi:hypothetical protein